MFGMYFFSFFLTCFDCVIATKTKKRGGQPSWLQSTYLLPDACVHLCRRLRAPADSHSSWQSALNKAVKTLMFVISKRSAPGSPPYHAPPTPLSGSVMMSKMSFSSVVSREQTAGLWGHRQINEDAGSIKAEIFQLPSGDNTAKNQKTICSPACSSLRDNCSSKERCCTGYRTDLWYHYANKRQASTVSWTHTHAFRRSLQWVAKWKIFFKRVHGNSSSWDQHTAFLFPKEVYSFRKLTLREGSFGESGEESAAVKHFWRTQLKEPNRDRQLGWTLRLAAYCMHALRLALQLLSVALVQSVWGLFSGPWRGLKHCSEGKVEGWERYLFLVCTYSFVRASLSSRPPLVSELWSPIFLCDCHTCQNEYCICAPICMQCLNPCIIPQKKYKSTIIDLCFSFDATHAEKALLRL